MEKQNKFINLFNKHQNLLVNIALLIIGVILLVFGSISFLSYSKHKTDYVIREDVVSRIEKLSKYSPNLKNTSADSDIYIIEGELPGPSLLILGGTHANEPSSNLTATMWLENLKVERGTVFIITETNASAMTNTLPQEGSRQFYEIETPFGKRIFKFGSRASSFGSQWPNPEIYVHRESGQKLSSGDARNLNRAYPGAKNGNLTEQIAYGIVELINHYDINITIDLHEASPEYLTNNAIVHMDSDEARNVAASAYIELEIQDIRISVESSPASLRGLTHRELGDVTNTMAFLLETSNASQGRLRGAFTKELIVTGQDKFYKKAEELGLLFAPPVHINERVGRHTATISAIVNGYNKLMDQNGRRDGLTQDEIKELQFSLSNIPTYNEVLTNGVGNYLLEVKK